jgi:PadR family transcriptional regulator, regulatory protein AphA
MKKAKSSKTGDVASKSGISGALPKQSREKGSRFAVLGMLSLGPKSGYDIKKTIAASTANFWSESYGNIYPVLKQLATEGAIEPEKDTGAGEGRPKQTFRMTAHGRKMLQNWLRQPVALRTEDNELLLKLFFGAVVSPKDMLAVVRAQHVLRVEELARYAEIAKYIAAQTGSEEQKIYWMATLRYGELTSRAAVTWCEEVERKLQRLSAPTS